MNRVYINTILGFTFFGLAACTNEQSLKSTHFASRSNNPIQGVVYSLPLVRIPVTFGAPQSPPIKFEALRFIPDPNARYILETKPSSMAHDAWTIEVNEDGLLDTVNATHTDQTSAIVKTGLTSVSDILKLQPLAPAQQTGKKSVKGTFLIDPYGNNKELPFTVEVRFLDGNLQAGKKAGFYRDLCPPGSGVCVSVPTVVEVKVTLNATTATETFVIPDLTKTVGLKVPRYACVETKNSVALQNGMVKSYGIDKPSEVAGCLSIPLDIVSAIIAAPVDALTGRTAKLKKEQANLEAQRLLLEEQQKLQAQIQEANSTASQD